MKKEFELSQGQNILRIQTAGQTFLRIFDAAGKLLITFRGGDFGALDFPGNPGKYILESDGQTLEAQAVSVERTAIARSVEVLEYVPGEANSPFLAQIDGEVYRQPPAALLESKLLTLGEFKNALTAYFEKSSVQFRAQLIPDHKMIYALMGVYPAHEKTAIEATVAKFQSEYVIAERLIKSAKTLEEVLAVRPQFPTELLGSIKKSVSRPKQTKK